jgi:type 2 lantibiotic biosynthesis protein LanM
MNDSTFFTRIYLKSLTPFEILDFRKKNGYSTNVAIDRTYIDLLIKSIDKEGSEDALKKYCVYNNLSDLDILLMISKVDKFENKVILPFWVKSLEDVLNSIDLNTVLYDVKKPFYQLLLPFLDFFSSKITYNFKQSNLPLLKKENLSQLSLALYNELLETSQSVFLTEFERFKERETQVDMISDDSDFFYKKFILSHLKDNFKNLFLNYPMLVRKMMTITQRYVDFISKVFNRLESDKKEIESCFNLTIQEINKIYLNLGDQHNGESTLIIEFEHSNKIVYKPTNGDITNAYNSFISWVNENLDENLKTFKVISKKTYSWLEFVEYLPCDSINEVKTYYEKAGILLGVAYFLNANDLHFENVIASGNCPVFIDHETIVSPKLKTIYKGSKESKHIISETVLETGLLPIQFSTSPYYTFGYGSSSMSLESITNVSKIKNPNRDDMVLISEMQTIQNYKSNKPIFNGKIENIVHYEKELERGFQKLYNLILNDKNYLLSKNSPIISFHNSSIRFINRATNVYFKILKMLNKPEYLADSIKYGIKLEVLARVYIAAGNYSPIVNHEREQMLLNDIPVFYINTSDNSIDLPSGKNIKIIESNVVENISEKIEKACVYDFKEQIFLIKDSIKL